MEQFLIYPLFSLNITLTNLVFYLMMAGFVTLFITSHSISRSELTPTWWGILNESFYRTIMIIIESSIGSKYTIYLPLLYTIFHII